MTRTPRPWLLLAATVLLLGFLVRSFPDGSPQDPLVGLEAVVPDSAPRRSSGQRAEPGPRSAAETGPQAPEGPAPVSVASASGPWGALEGSLLLDPAGPLRGPWLVRLEGPGRSWPLNGSPPDAQGNFRFESLRPGTYELRLEHDGDTMAHVEGLVVVAGQVNRDPRLRPLDARDPVATMRLVLAPGGPRPEQVQAFVDLGLHGRNWSELEQGRLVLRAPRGTLQDVQVVARGRRPLRIPFVEGERTIELQAGIPVRLRARGSVRLAEGVRRVWFVARPEAVPWGGEPTDHQVEFEGSALLAGREQSVSLPFPGSYRLFASASSSTGPGFLPLYRSEASEPFDVQEGTDGTTLVLDLVEELRAED